MSTTPDIRKIRQIQRFAPIEDITEGGIMDQGYVSGERLPPTATYSAPPQDPRVGLQQPNIPAPAAPAAPKAPTSEYLTLQEQMDAMNKGYTPDYQSRDRYNELLGQFPERNKPSWARKLVAGGMAMKSQTPIETAEKAMYAPYLRDKEEWTTKTEPYYKAAQLENQANIQERTIVSNAATAAAAAARTAAQERSAALKNEASMIRAKAYDYSMRLGKGWDWNLNGPTALKKNNTTGEIFDTGLPTGKMDEELKIELQNEGRIEAAKQTGVGALERTGVSTRDLYQDPAGNHYLFDPQTKKLEPLGDAPAQPTGALTKPGTPPRSSTANEPNRLEKEYAEQQRYKALWEHDVNEAKKYMTLANGKFTMKPRPKVGDLTGAYGFRTPVTQEEVNKWDEFKKQVDPNYAPSVTGQSIVLPNQGNGTQNQNQTPPAQKPPRPAGAPANAWVQYADDGEVRYSIDGGKNWIYPNRK